MEEELEGALDELELLQLKEVEVEKLAGQLEEENEMKTRQLDKLQEELDGSVCFLCAILCWMKGNAEGPSHYFTIGTKLLSPVQERGSEGLYWFGELIEIQFL